jgi:hypothetical protein
MILQRKRFVTYLCLVRPDIHMACPGDLLAHQIFRGQLGVIPSLQSSPGKHTAIQSSQYPRLRRVEIDPLDPLTPRKKLSLHIDRNISTSSPILPQAQDPECFCHEDSKLSRRWWERIGGRTLTSNRILGVVCGGWMQGTGVN